MITNENIIQMNSQYPLVFFEVKFLISIFSFQYLEIKTLKLFSRQKFKLKAYQKYKIGKIKLSNI